MTDRVQEGGGNTEGARSQKVINCGEIQRKKLGSGKARRSGHMGESAKRERKEKFV